MEEPPYRDRRGRLLGLNLGPNPHFISRYRRDFGKRKVSYNVQKEFQISDLMDASGSLLQTARITVECLTPSEPLATPSLLVTFCFQKRAVDLTAAKRVFLDHELYFPGKASSDHADGGQWRYLPRVLGRHIASFMPEFYSLKTRFMIHFPKTFPIGNAHLDAAISVKYGHPYWEFLDLETNLEIPPVLLHAHFRYKTRMHNQLYSSGVNWSPAYGLRQDILIFFVRIYHFEEIVAYQTSC